MVTAPKVAARSRASLREALFKATCWSGVMAWDREGAGNSGAGGECGHDDGAPSRCFCGWPAGVRRR